MLWYALALAAAFCSLQSAAGDTPANCTHESIAGSWTFSVGDPVGDNTIDCKSSTSFAEKAKVTIDLKFPDVAVDEYGREGFWTIIYNQGFEVVINNKKYFAFSYYVKTGNVVTSYCDQTFNGWAHDVLGYNWACFKGRKNSFTQTSPSMKSTSRTLSRAQLNRKHVNNTDFVQQINKRARSWKAAYYPIYETMTLKDLQRRSGGKATGGKPRHPPTAPLISEHKKLMSSLPTEFDWRNKEGVNYISPIRNQEKCGSCYAFGSMAMLEARVRILSHNQLMPVFSTQDIVSCSSYSQGCEGGFPYLIAGKYGQDFGVTLEECFPYTGNDTTACVLETPCQRYRTADYHYIGGFYGACNEALMMDELVHNGPIAVSFEVTKDFQQYRSGIYHQTGLQDSFNPWEITNHVVAVVGYGVEDGEKYWIVKNSWGTEWGEDGFFRIRRGTDELAIESMAVAATPILP